MSPYKLDEFPYSIGSQIKFHTYNQNGGQSITTGKIVELQTNYKKEIIACIIKESGIKYAVRPEAIVGLN